MASSDVPWITSARKTGTPVARDIASAPVMTMARKIAAGTTPSGLRRGQHGDDDAAVAVARREIAHHLKVHAADLADAGEPGERAGDQRGDDDDPADSDAAIARGLGVVADDADLEAERGARDQQPDDARRDDGGSTPRCSRVTCR